MSLRHIALPALFLFLLQLPLGLWAQKTKDKSSPEEVKFDVDYVAPKSDSTTKANTHSNKPIEKESGSEKKESNSSKPVLSPKGHKDRYQIAIFLPFGADSLEGFYSRRISDLSNASPDDDEDADIPFSSELSVQYYEGLKMAFNKVSKAGLKLDLHIYDFRNSSEFFDRLKDSCLLNSDLVIGPVGSQSGRKLADFCREHNIWHILPFTTGFKTAQSSPYLIKLNPDLAYHWTAAIDHFADSNRKVNVIYLREHNVADSLANFVIRDHVNELNQGRTDSIWYTEMVINDKTLASSVSEKYRTGCKNVVLVNSYKSWMAESFTKALSGTKNALVGLPQWILLEKIDYSNLRELEFYYTDELYSDKSSADYKEVNKAYKLNWHSDIPERTLQGYDTGLWLAGMLTKSGLDWQSDLQLPYNGISLDIKLQAIYADQQLLYYENRAVPVIRVINWQSRKMN